MRPEDRGTMLRVLQSSFLVTAEKGEVSSLLVRPRAARWLLVLGHGAGAGMRHRHMEAMAQNLARRDIASFRYQFPFMERGGGRDSLAVSIATVRAAVAAAYQAAPDLALLAGGHSFGGRMTSNAAAREPLHPVRGLIFFSYPLHPPGKPGTDRAEHLKRVAVPMLFCTGTRDKLAQLDLLRPVCADLGKRTTLHLLDSADHGYSVLKRTRESAEDVYEETARVCAEWSEGLPA